MLEAKVPILVHGRALYVLHSFIKSKQYLNGPKSLTGRDAKTCTLGLMS